MSVYLDASVLVALFTDDVFTSQADDFLRSNSSILIVSDFAAAEFSGVVARHVRTRDITPDEARTAFSTFDVWIARATQRAQTTSADVTTVETFLRRLDLTIQAPDALNLAIALRVGATLLTFDKTMASSARRLKIPVDTA